MAFDELHDEALNRTYQQYTQALHTQEKTNALYSGVKEILSHLRVYKYDPEKFKEKSQVSLNELQNLLDRYYYNDREFQERLMFEAKAYVIELENE